MRLLRGDLWIALGLVGLCSWCVKCDMFVMDQLGLSVLHACLGCTVTNWDLGDLLPGFVH